MAFALFSFVSCSSSPPEPRPDPRDAVIQQLKDEIAGLKAENQRLKEDSANAQRDASKWSTLAMVAGAGAVIGAVLALVVGTAIGSRTRHDSQRRAEKADRNQGEEAQL